MFFDVLRVSPLKILTKGSAFGNRKPLKRLDPNFMVLFVAITSGIQKSCIEEMLITASIQDFFLQAFFYVLSYFQPF